MSTYSKQAYIDVQPQIKPSEELILSFLSHGGATLHEVSRTLSMPLQTASARLSELHDKGYVKQGGIMGVYYLSSIAEREGVKAARDEERFRKWCKLGSKNNYFAKLEAQQRECYFNDDGTEMNPSPELPLNQLPF